MHLILEASSYKTFHQYLNMEYIRYSRACGSNQDFLDIGLVLTRKLLNQGILLVKLQSVLRKLYGHHHDLVDRYGIYVSQITTDMFHCRKHFPVLSSLLTSPGL
jgi:hypothetical protein